MAIYRTTEGDTVDYICWKYYGSQVGATEKVLLANPGLADKGVVLPVGIMVALPAIRAAESGGASLIRLWD